MRVGMNIRKYNEIFSEIFELFRENFLYLINQVYGCPDFFRLVYNFCSGRFIHLIGKTASNARVMFYIDLMSFSYHFNHSCGSCSNSVFAWFYFFYNTDFHFFIPSFS